MQTIFELSSAEYKALKSEGLALEVGGARFQIRVQTRQKRLPATRVTVKAAPKRRRKFHSKFKIKVARYAKATSPGKAAKAYGIARSVVARWAEEAA